LAGADLLFVRAVGLCFEKDPSPKRRDDALNPYQFMKPRSHLLLGGFPLAIVLLQGCAVGPNYQQPKTAAPAQWSAPMAGGETNVELSIASWWKSFRDPELDSLLERAVKANHDLRIAGARVREARALNRIEASRLWPTIDAGG